MSITNNFSYNFELGKQNFYNSKIDVKSEKIFKLKSYEKSDIITESKLEDLRKASLIQKLIRKQVYSVLKPGLKYYDLKTFIESKAKTYCKENSGLAYPIGISVNNVAAHDSSYVGDVREFKLDDIVKIDFGIHVNGNIIDTAFTTIIGYDFKTELSNSEFYPLIKATADATYNCISQSGPDQNIMDLSQNISEIIKSYEIEKKNGDVIPIIPINALGGHNILPYKIHGGKLILSSPHHSQKGMRMEENEIYAIETYATTGPSRIRALNNSTHFMIKDPESKLFVKEIKSMSIRDKLNNFNTMPFHSDWILTNNKERSELDFLVKKNLVESFPPFADDPNTFTSQLEHTICIKSTGTEILSLDTDY